MVGIFMNVSKNEKGNVNAAIVCSIVKNHILGFRIKIKSVTEYFPGKILTQFCGRRITSNNFTLPFGLKVFII